MENELKIQKDLKDESDKKTNDIELKLQNITSLYESEQEKKEKLNIKLKSYRDKILKCASCINQLKNSRYILSNTVKEYSESIPKWQKEIIKASKILDGQINDLNNEIKISKEKLHTLEHEYKNIFDRNSELIQENKNLQHQNMELRNQNKVIALQPNISSDVEALQLQIKSLESEKSILVKEKFNARDHALELENQIKIITNELNNIKIQRDSIQSELDGALQQIQNFSLANSTDKEEENISLKNEIKLLYDHIEILKKENQNLVDLNGILKDEVDTLKLSLEQPNDGPENLSDINASLQADIVKLEAKLSVLQEDNAILLDETKESRLKLKQFEAVLSELEETKEKLMSYKKENSELLIEMKEITQVLKERGENISKQEKAIIEMEKLIEKIELDRDNVKSEKDNLQKKYTILENELKDIQHYSNKEHMSQILLEHADAVKIISEKDFIITSLKDEIDKLKQHISNCKYYQK